MLTSVIFRRWYSKFPKFHRYPSQMVSTLSPNKPSQDYDYFLVLDFEATCDRNKQMDPQEIIEFPCLKVSGKTYDVESVFHQYVRPRIHPQLTSFCTELTGIIQEMVDGQPHLEEVMVMFQDWMKEEKLLEDDTSSIFVTCGDWDLNVMLPNQCEYFKIFRPDYLKTWINIKKTFCTATNIWPKSIRTMLEYFLLSHQGRLHSGIDDCKNIAAILKALATKHNVRFEATGHRP